MSTLLQIDLVSGTLHLHLTAKPNAPKSIHCKPFPPGTQCDTGCVEPCPQEPLLRLSPQRSDVRHRDFKRTCPCLCQLDGSSQNDSSSAVGGKHILKGEQRPRIGISIQGGALVCYSLISSLSVPSGVVAPGCPRDLCANIVDKERANPLFNSTSIYEVPSMGKVLCTTSGIYL